MRPLPMTLTGTELFKVLGPKGQAVHGGKGKWKLPKGKRPGAWMPQIAEPRCCQRGFHLVKLWALPQWLQYDCTIYLAEGRGASHTDGSGKTAFAQARLLRRVYISECDLRLFACDCAEHVLGNFSKLRPDDTRPAEAIAAARSFARGEIDAKMLGAAAASARSAAESAGWSARSAAQSARSAAESAGWSARSAAEAALSAAWSAAWSAARSAARSERDWQGTQLATYLKEAQ